MIEVNPQELYNRQNEMGLRVPETVSIIGLGGGGSWVAISLALMGVPNIKVCDNDFIEESNLNRTLFRYSDINKLKTEAVASLILERRPKCNVIAYPKTSIKMYEDWQAGICLDFPDFMDTNIVIDASDNYQTRSLMEQLYSKGDLIIPYCKLGYDGTEFEIDFSFAPIQDSNLQGYRRINTFVGTVMSEVSMLVNIIGLNYNQGNEILYKLTADKAVEVAQKRQKIYVPPAVTKDYSKYKLIPITEDMSATLKGKEVFINIEPSNYENSRTVLFYGGRSSMSMYGMCQKCFKVGEVLLDGRRAIEPRDGKTGVTLRDYSWAIEDMLLVTDELLEPEAEYEVEESEEEYLIEEDI